MPLLAEHQRAFGSALLDAALPMPIGWVGPDGEPSSRRFSVYRNNVVAGLIETLKDAYPAVHRIVGEDFFKAMAREYATVNPPRSPIMLAYGADFADFINGFGPASGLAYLPDVARIERAWAEAYHSPEATPLAALDLMHIEPDRLSDVRLVLHPSLHIVRCRLPALTIWRMNGADGAPGPVDLDDGGEDVLVIRPAAEVEVRQMPPGGAAFLSELSVGNPVTEATKHAMRECTAFDLADFLSGLIDAGAFVDWSLPDEAGPVRPGRNP